MGADMGLTRAPFPSPDAREISGLSTTLSLTAVGQMAPAFVARLRVALVLADVDLPAGAVRPNTAFGHPEAALVWRFHARGDLALFAEAGLAAPIGGDDAALGRRPFDNQSLVLASAQRGWRDGELFAPGRLAVTPAIRVEFARARYRGFAMLKVPALVAARSGGADPRVEVRPVALATVLGAGAAAQWGRFSVGAAPWLVVNAVPGVLVRGESAPRWSLSVAPEVRARITEHLTAAIGSTILVAGALHGLPSLALALAGNW